MYVDVFGKVHHDGDQKWDLSFQGEGVIMKHS